VRQRFEPEAAATPAMNTSAPRTPFSALSFRFDPALKYNVNRNAGLCKMELIGYPGTRFELIEG